MDTIDDLDELVQVVTGEDRIYVRYSKGPDHDEQQPSRDYEADLDPPGLPVTNLWPEPWWSRPPVDWIARRMCKYLELAEDDPDRRPWLLTGTVAGYGPDHEPLVADVHPVAWVGDHAVQQARERYHSTFHVGRSSSG